MKQKSLEPSQIKLLQECLLRQQEEIHTNGKVLRMECSTSEDDLKDEVDLALSDIEQSMKTRLGNRESLYGKKIGEALVRIEEGVYGHCTQCGAEIGFRRLEARPTAELCIECKENAERAETLNAEGRKHKSLGQAVSFRS